MKFLKLFLRKKNLSQNTLKKTLKYIFFAISVKTFSLKKKKCFSRNAFLCSRCNFLLSCQDFAFTVRIVSWAGPRSYWPVGWASSCLGSRTESLHHCSVHLHRCRLCLMASLVEHGHSNVWVRWWHTAGWASSVSLKIKH